MLQSKKNDFTKKGSTHAEFRKVTPQNGVSSSGVTGLMNMERGGKANSLAIAGLFIARSTK